MNKTIIVALFGAAGSGKDTLQKEIAKQSPYLFHEIISSTTRPPREYEKDGVDYVFISDEDAQGYLLDNQYIEHATFRGWTYGTLKCSLKADKINIGVFNISGVHQLLNQPKDEYIIVPIYIKCSDKERLLRQLNREVNPDCKEICRRFSADMEDLSKENLDFNYLFINNEYENIEYIAEVAREMIYEKIISALWERELIYYSKG